jgi:hypothetical protein
LSPNNPSFGLPFCAGNAMNCLDLSLADVFEPELDVVLFNATGIRSAKTANLFPYAPPA